MRYVLAIYLLTGSEPVLVLPHVFDGYQSCRAAAREVHANDPHLRGSCEAAPLGHGG